MSMEWKRAVMTALKSLLFLIAAPGMVAVMFHLFW